MWSPKPNMCHREIHNEGTRRRKAVDLCLGFLQEYIVLNLNITPFFASCRRYLVHLKFVTLWTEQSTQFINNPVVKLWRCWFSLECLQMVPKCIVMKSIACTMLSTHTDEEKWSSLVRHLMWMMKSKGFQVSVRVGFLPGSIAVISWAITDVWALSEQVLGSRSWTLVSE